MKRREPHNLACSGLPKKRFSPIKEREHTRASLLRVAQTLAPRDPEKLISAIKRLGFFIDSTRGRVRAEGVLRVQEKLPRWKCYKRGRQV